MKLKYFMLPGTDELFVAEILVIKQLEREYIYSVSEYFDISQIEGV